MRRTAGWCLPSILFIGGAIASIAVSSCSKDDTQLPVADWSGAKLDTVTTLNDDRTAITALATMGGVQAILSDTAPFVEVVNGTDGPARFGGAGDGPAEFRVPSGIALWKDSIAVWDPAAGRLAILDPSGRSLRVQSVPVASGKILGRILHDGYGNAGHIAATPSGLIVPVYHGSVRQHFGLWSTALVHIRPDGSLDTVPVHFPPVDSLRALNNDTRELVAIPLWASCGTHGLAIWEPVGERLQRYPTEGTPGRYDSVGGTSIPLTGDLVRINLRFQLDALLRDKRPDSTVYGQMIESMAVGSERRYPRTSPIFVSMQCDDDGTVWLQHFSLTDAGSGMGRTWTLVDSAGERRDVRLPPDLRVLSIADSVVWGVRDGGEGELYLVKFAVPGP